MKYFIRFAGMWLAVMCLVIFISCSKSTEPEISYDFPEAVDSAATNITLSVYPIAYDTLLATIALETEGMAVIEFADTSYLYHSGFNIYAEAEGFYTELRNCQNGDTILVDLDGVPDEPYAITGVIFARHEFEFDRYFGERSINVDGPNELSLTIITDEQGRFGLGNLPAGIYTISFICDSLIAFEITNTPGTNYEDMSFIEESLVRAPFIYLYPETEMNIAVELGFPQGGRITESEPLYGSGWNVHVTPDGIIDGQYSYLLYEGVLSVPFNYDAAWILSGSDLENEIRNLLETLGFAGREIGDFVNYWLPIIEGSPWYAFYPQNVESIVTLDITPAPDNILRALFIIYPLEQPVSIPEPEIPDNFTRDGFTVVEWGVIGWHD